MGRWRLREAAPKHRFRGNGKGAAEPGRRRAKRGLRILGLQRGELRRRRRNRDLRRDREKEVKMEQEVEERVGEKVEEEKVEEKGGKRRSLKRRRWKGKK